METTTTPTEDRVILPAAPPPQSLLSTSDMLKGMGGVLLAVTALLIWKEAAMEAVMLLLGASAATLVGSIWLERKKTPVIGPLVTLGAAFVGAGWYGATRDPMVLGALGLSFTTFLGLAWHHRDRTRVPSTKLHRALTFQGVAWSGLALSLASDFHLFHGSELLDEHFLARRVILTVAWLVAGLGFLVLGSKREDGPVQGAGSVLMVASLSKLLLYDTTHLDGVLRIAAFAAAGGLLMLGGNLLTRKSPVVAS
jgi:uncharacterized membrane protein